MKRTRLRPIAKSNQAANDLYYRVTKPLWLTEHPGCQFEFHKIQPEVPTLLFCGQTYGADVHHMMRRGKYLNDVRYFMTVCPVHHAYIETYKKQARKLGYILYK